MANLEKQLQFFLSDSFTAARRRLAEARLGEDKQSLKTWDLDAPPVSAFEVLDFYEHLGLLVKKGHLEIYDVWHTFYEWAQPVYVDMQQMIENEDSAYSDHYSDLKRLMRSMDEIQLHRMHANNANHWALWTPDRILEHYRYELEAAGAARRPRRSRRKAAEVAREEWLDIDGSAANAPEWPEGAAPPEGDSGTNDRGRDGLKRENTHA